MKILMVLPHKYPPDPRVGKEASTLVKSGHDLHLLCLNLDGKPEQETIDGVKVYRINPQFKGLSGFFMKLIIKLNPILRKKEHIAKSQNPIKDFLGITSKFMFRNIDNFCPSLWYKEITDLVKKYDYDVIHVHDLPLVRTVLSIARKYNKKVIFDMHENWPEAMRAHTNYGILKKLLLDLAVNTYKKQEKMSWKYSDRIIVVVKESKDRLINLGVPEDKITVVSNSVDSDYFDNNKNNKISLNTSQEDTIISYTGTFGTHRGLDIAIRAMAKVVKSNKNVKLLLVGDGPNKSNLEKLVKELNLQDNVIFTGFVDQKYLPAYVSKSDIGLILHTSNPHTNSTIPHKLFEYMYMKKPVIVTDVKPLKRIVSEEKCGLVVKYDASEVAEAILKLADKNLYQDLAENGQKAAIEKYTWNVISDSLKKVYKSL